MKIVRQPDRTNILGRCRSCNVAYTWRRGDLQLGDAHCLICGASLSPTTRVLRTGFRLVEDADTLSMIVAGQRAAERRLFWERRQVQKWINDGVASEDTRAWMVEMCKERVKTEEARIARLDKAYARVTKRLAVPA